MGNIKVNLGALKQQAESAKKAAMTATKSINNYQQAIHSFSGNESLTGKAYNTAKSLCSGPLTSLLTGMCDFYEEAGLVLEKLVMRYETMVDTKSWDSEELKRLIQLSNHAIANHERAIKRLKHKKVLTPTADLAITKHKLSISSHEALKRRYEKILHGLEQFSSQSAFWFNTLNHLSASLKRAIASLTGGLNASTGQILLPKDYEWEKELKDFHSHMEQFRWEAKVERLPQEGQDIVRDLEKSYGLDIASVYLIYKLQQGIMKKAKEENWDNKKIIFEYNRLIASCSYSMKSLKGKYSRKNNDFKLYPDQPHYVSLRWQALCQTEDWETMQKYLSAYGLSNTEIKQLRQGISI